MNWPVLISVPHAGWKVPPEVRAICRLSEREILEDGDEGAAEIYSPLQDQAAGYVTTDIARAVVDQNRAEDDFRRDGVVKTHTCWDVPVYRRPLSAEITARLIERYHRPYHARLSSGSASARLGLDCHTMAAAGPPVGPDPGEERPPVCLSNAYGTCPEAWFLGFAECLERSLDVPVSLNHPFKGGYIIRSHGQEMPWMQLEWSRGDFLTSEKKSSGVIDALDLWTQHFLNHY